MWLDVSDAEARLRDDLVGQLRALGVYYLGGGSLASPCPTHAHQIERLIGGLTRSRDARLRTALTALLLHQPRYVATAIDLATTLDDPHAFRHIQVSVLAAAALQRTWAFSLDLYQPGWQRIEAAALAHALGVPPPDEDYGRATLRALNAVLGGDDPAAPDYWGAWEDVGRHVIDDLRAGCAHGA